MIMDHDAGRSTTSASKTFGDSVASCTISFQGHREVAQLYAALARHALRTTGVQIQFDSLTGFVRRSDVLSLLPSALAPASCSATCTGVLAECVRSPSDVAKFASVFCNNDTDLAMEWIVDGISALGTHRSPSALCPLIPLRSYGISLWERGRASVSDIECNRRLGGGDRR